MSRILVPFDGPLDAKIALVGEAPNVDEVRVGKPFVGESGNWLDRYLASVSLRRSDIYINNVVKERPPGNNIETFIYQIKQGKCKGEVVTTDLYDIYEDQLREELSACSANVIVPLDNTALWAVARKWGIEKWRGSMIESVLELGKRKVIPTFHPAATLYDPLLQIPLKLDLRRISGECSFPELRLTPRTMRIFPTFDEIIDYIEACNTLTRVGFDIETKPCGGSKHNCVTWEMTCFSLAHSATDSMCIPIFGPEGIMWDERQLGRILLAVGKVLENPNVTKVGQNLNFDCSFMLNKFGLYCWPIYDTMVAQRLIFTDLLVGLDFITSLYTDIPYYKEEGKQWDQPDNWPAFFEYSCKDSLATMEAMPKQLRELENNHNKPVYERHIRTIPALLYMQERGVRSDEARMHELSETMAGEIEEKKQHLLALVTAKATTYEGRTGKTKEYDLKFANSSDQCKAFFYGVLGIKPYTKYDRKKRKSVATTDDEAMTRLSRRGIDEANMVLRIREEVKLKGTYLDMKLDKGRLKCSYTPNVRTGRLASSKNIFGIGGNLQNPPREGPFKKAILCDEGYAMIGLDSSQAEARILAHCGRVETKAKAFDRGDDVYALTASYIARQLGFNLTVEQIIEEHERKIMAPVAARNKSWRGLGKECDLALGYNMGPDRFSRRTELPFRDARILHQAWHMVYPEVRNNYHTMIRAMLNDNRTVINPFGRRRRFLGKHSKTTESKSDILEPAYAHFCQSTVADLIAEWGLAFVIERQDLFAELEILLQIHDSIISQIPIAVGWPRIAEIMNTLKASLEQPIHWEGVTFTIPVSVSVSGFSLGNAEELGTAVPTAETLETAYERTKHETQ